MEESNLQKNRKGDKPSKGIPGWVVGIEMFSNISAWIVGPIVIALILGKILDKKFGTEPIIFLFLAGIGFLATCFGIIKIVRKYIKDSK